MVEEKEEWLVRRLRKLVDEKMFAGEDLELAEIKRKMKLKTNAYKKYADLIKEMIKNMNKS